VAVDHNQMVMEALKRIAGHHGLTCLLHEKPFAGINGSGKHNNWSLTTDDGINLMNPGETPHENIQFLLVLACIMKAVDIHADLLRESTPAMITVWEQQKLRRLSFPFSWVSSWKT
jgi:glutamine synthetase